MSLSNTQKRYIHKQCKVSFDLNSFIGPGKIIEMPPGYRPIRNFLKECLKRKRYYKIRIDNGNFMVIDRTNNGGFLGKIK